ncbi:MAG: DUF2071 domain-containing protein [Actinomycetota bacterium]|nr:DUF2071 domain-containing protein [Actinomycetota bacterium]
MGQTWDDLLFAHWAVPEADLRQHVPDSLQLDTHDGKAYLGITPFKVTAVRMRGTLPLPRVSTFLELNVRTYVTEGRKPGIWFFSLDASSQLAVEAAKLLYHLPYFCARISSFRRGGDVVFECARDEEPRTWSGSYRPDGEVFHALPGSVEHFFAERYCLYTVDRRGRRARAEIHHRPWPLQVAQADIELNTMPPDGVVLAGKPLLHFSKRLDVVLWPLEPVRAR